MGNTDTFENIRIGDNIGPSNKAVLIAGINDEKFREQIQGFCEQIWPLFPKKSDPLFVWRTCWAAGIHVPYFRSIERMLLGMQKTGWVLIGADQKPKQGDLVIYQQGKYGIRMEFYAKNIISKTPGYIGFSPESYGRRNKKDADEVFLSEDRHVLYYLRFVCKACDLNANNN